METDHSRVVPLLVTIALGLLSLYLAWQAVRPPKPVKRREERDGD